MLKKKTERLIPQSDQPKKQVSRGKVTVPKNPKQNALSTEKNSLENRKTAKKPTAKTFLNIFISPLLFIMT